MLIRIIGLLIVSNLMLGCSLSPTKKSHDSADSLETSATEQSIKHTQSDLQIKEDEEYSAFSTDTLFSLLVAEIAGQRQQYEISLANYLEQAQTTQDPAIAERATHIAQYLGSKRYAFEAAKVWVATAPNNPTAHQSLAQALISSGDFINAFEHMKTEFELTGESQFDFLALSAQNLNIKDKLNLLSRLELFTQTHSNYAPLWLSQGHLLSQLGEYSAALITINKSLKLQQDYTTAQLAKSRVYHHLGQTEEALVLLDGLHTKVPSNKGIAILRAKVLIDLNRYQDARDAFYSLSQQFTNDDSIKLSLALLHMELQEYDEAIAIFNSLTVNKNISNDAYFYLAMIAEQQKDTSRALRNYDQIEPSQQFLPSIVKSSNILIYLENINAAREYIQYKREQFPEYTIELIQIEIELLSSHHDFSEGFQLASNALVEYPDNTSLLYSRGLLAEKMGDFPQLEKDLRRIITLEPDNAEALNALGYSMSNSTGRHKEALTLIEKALTLSPRNPAILDSLGWVHYKIGNLSYSLEILEKAFASFPDHEVSAHLGEVLWALGKKNEARDIWAQGLEKNPESPIIEETMKRLNANSLTLEP